MPAPILPDAVKIVADEIRSAGIGLIGTRVYGFRLPASPTYPAVRVTRLGGATAAANWLDGARLQIDVFGGTEEQAWDATAAVRSELADLDGKHIPGIATVTGIEELSGPGWLPDPTTQRARWTWDIRLFVHP